MKKYDQPIRESNRSLNQLFLSARYQLFLPRDQGLRMIPPKPLTPKPRVQRKTAISAHDKEFQKWLLSLDAHQSKNNISQSVPVLVNTVAIKKPRKSIDINGKAVDGESPEPSIEQPAAATRKRTKKVSSKKKDEDDEEEADAQASSTIGKRISLDSKPFGSASFISKLSARASSLFTENIPSRNIVFNGMTTVSNRLKWNQSGNDTFTVDLDEQPLVRIIPRIK
jgi:hypothetical protein